MSDEESEGMTNKVFGTLDEFDAQVEARRERRRQEEVREVNEFTMYCPEHRMCEYCHQNVKETIIEEHDRTVFELTCGCTPWGKPAVTRTWYYKGVKGVYSDKKKDARFEEHEENVKAMFDQEKRQCTARRREDNILIGITPFEGYWPEDQPVPRFMVQEYIFRDDEWWEGMVTIFCNDVELIDADMAAGMRMMGVGCYNGTTLISRITYASHVYYDSTKLDMNHVTECRAMFDVPLSDVWFTDLKGKPMPEIYKRELLEEDWE